MTVLRLPPILCNKEHTTASVFSPENLLREARRQRNIPSGKIPEICVLDPDGDIVRNLLEQNKCFLNPHWACYHSKLYDFELEYSGMNEVCLNMVKDAFRETAKAIESYRKEGICAVEMGKRKWLSLRAMKPKEGRVEP